MGEMGMLLAGHEALLKRLAAGLGEERVEIIRLGEALGVLRGDGVFLNGRGEPVVPGWWERVEDGVCKGWYLVWPSEHVREVGVKRRQYVRAAALDEVRGRVARTQRYKELKALQDSRLRNLWRVEVDLRDLARRWGW